MTEVVTSSAAISQLGLLAEKPQAFRVDQDSTQFQLPALAGADVGHERTAEALAKAGSRSPSKHGDQSAPDQQPAPSGPSKPKIEIRSFDLGRTPAEVVGTPDIIQRFDVDGDGRINMFDAQDASRARAKQGTYRGLATAAALARKAADDFDAAVAAAVAKDDVAAATKPAVAAAVTPVQASPTPANETERKKFAEALVQNPAEVAQPGTKKFRDAAEGTQPQAPGSDGVDVARKYFGQGAEVVVSRAGGPPPGEAPVKYFDKAAESTRGTLSEDGSGETKYYDKVAQTESGSDGGSPDGGQQQQKMYDRAQQTDTAGQYSAPDAGSETMYEKAQQVADLTGLPVAAEIKKLHAELDAYTNAAGYQGAAATAAAAPVPPQVKVTA